MPWTCPVCKKSFRNVEQWHSCARLSVDDHLVNKDPSIASLAVAILEYVTKWPDVIVNPVKSSIQIKAGATFMSIRVKKKYLALEFQLDREEDQFPIEKIFRLSKNRVVHQLKLDHPDEFDDQLKSWLFESYQLIH